MNGILAKLKSQAFFSVLAIIALSYLAFELIYIPYWVLAVDEFVFAKHILEYTQQIPYRDFPPYKGVIGYYLLSLPLFFSKGLLQPLFYIKYEIAILNTIFIFLAACLASTLFNKKAVVLALLAILANQLFFLYASDLRVDMLSVWGALFATLAVLKGRTRLGGAILGIAFLISQKVVWYFLAINGAFFLCWMIFSSPLFSFRNMLLFNLAFAAPILVYIALWAELSHFSTVIYSLFYEAYIQARIQFYAHIYLTCWWVSLTHGTLLYFLWPLTFLSLFDKNINEELARRTFIIVFASIALLFFITYKQPFPYNFVFAIPAFFILYTSFLSWLFEQKNKIFLSVISFSTLLITAIYTYGLFFLIHIFSLSQLNYLIMIMPFLTILLLASNKNSAYFKAFLTLFVSLGIVYPFYITLVTSNRLNGDYQQTMINLSAQLLAKEGDYVGGVPYLFTKEQPISGIKNLIGPALDYLYEPSPDLELLLLPSLYLAPTSPQKIMTDLEKSDVKIILTNYRTLSLPNQVLAYIYDHYQHFYGSIYLYAPKITTKDLSFYLKFEGDYFVKANKGARIKIDGKIISPAKKIHLSKGDHTNESNRLYRLVLTPDVAIDNFNPAFAQDNWHKMINPIIA